MSKSIPADIAAIDTLRAMAIILVLAHHFFAYTGFSIPYFDQNGGLLGVQLFFLVSGFLIVQSAEKYTLKVFALHRFFRIFPPYLVALFLFGAGKYWLVPSYQNTIDAFAPYFFLNIFNLQLLHPVSVLMLDPLHVGWSLTVELFWYALAPLAVWWCARGARRRWLVLLLISTILSCTWVWLAASGRLHSLYESMFTTVGLSQSNSTLRHGVVDNAPPAQFMFFFMGACMHVFKAELSRIPSGWLWFLAAGIVLFVPQWNSFLQLFPNPITGIGLATLFVWIIRIGYTDGLTHWLAKVSYSIYLIHAPILLAIFHYLQWNNWGGLILSMLLIAAGAELGWRWVERPSQAFGKRLADRFNARLFINQ